jgi:hypothetical protein
MTMPMDDKEIASIFSKGAERHKQFGTPLPGGERYAMELSNCELGRSKKNNTPQVVETYKVISGEWEAKEVRQYTNLDNEVSWSILLQRWASLGFDASAVRSLDEVDEYCREIKASKLILQVLVTDQEGSDFKRLKIEAVSKPKKEATPAPKAKPAPAPAPTPTPAASVPEVPESEEEEEAPVAEAESEEEEGVLDIGQTCDFTFKGQVFTGVIKEFHVDPAGNEAENKVTFVANGKAMKVKVGNIQKIHPKT